MSREFLVLIRGARGKEWEQVLGTRTFHVQSPVPQPADLPGRENSLVYQLDLATLEPGQLDKIVAHVSRKFGVSESEVREDIARFGVPILVDDTWCLFYFPQKHVMVKHVENV